MGKRVRAFDWASTALGSPEQWPVSLRTLVNLLLASTQPMFVAWGPERTWLYNDAFIPILGRKHPEALGRQSREVWNEAWDVVGPMFDRVFAGEPVSIKDFALGLDRQGKVEDAHFEFAYTPSRGETGLVEGLFGTCIETTARVMAECRQAEAMDRQRRQFQCAPGFICILRGPDHVFEFVNESYVRLLGERDFLGKPVRQAVPEVEGQGFLELLDRVYQTGVRYVAQQTPISLIRSDGGAPEARVLDFVYEPILGDDREVTGIFVEGFDVTDSYRVHEKLRELNQSLERRVEERTADLMNIQTFYTHSSECHAILSRRADGRFQYDEVNPATLRLYGMSRETVIGRTVEEVFPPEVARELSQHLSHSVSNSAPYRYSRKQGNSTVEAIATPIPVAPGNQPRLAVTARDITERQNLEEQLRQAQKMEAVGQLAGGIAHDFNNMLAVVIGSLDLLQRRIGESDPRAKRYADAATEGARRAAQLTQRLLAFSRQQPLSPESLDLNKLVAGMSELLRHSLGADIQLERVLAGGLWCTRTDPNQLENVILNLAVNARDAMPEGGRLTIETQNTHLDERYTATHVGLAPGQYVLLAVSDTGGGMPEHVIAKAFDPFFSTKEIGKGTGLGLSQVYGFVRQSGGHVKIYSEVGQGTTVKVYLPRFLGEVPEVDDSGSAEDLPLGAQQEVVLVVEDEPAVRQFSVDALTELGYRVLEADSAAAAMRHLSVRPDIALLFTDVVMPDVNGAKLANEVRLRRPGIKVLFTTGYARNAVVHNGVLDAGVQMIGKPFTIEELAAKVREVLDTTV
jgi:PAS domain S-box-containing protein